MHRNALRMLRFSVEKRASGQAYLKVTSVGPVNEPFVDVLIEMTWPAGRIDQWGLSDKDVQALGVAERHFRFKREWEPSPPADAP